MGSLNPENEPKQELDDSGYVQEDATAKDITAEVVEKNGPCLLDLSNEVLLYILKFCTPRDLKALGFTCPRLGTLILDRTLWRNVEARAQPCGKRRVRWLLTHALSEHTTSLRLTGYAREAKGCLGFMSSARDEDGPLHDGPWLETKQPEERAPELASPQLFRLSAQALPRYGGGFPFWPEESPHPTACFRPCDPKKPEATGHTCPGPQITFSHAALMRLSVLCTNLTELALDYCVIDCNMTKISMFPNTLVKLSLRGTKCFNLEKSFLYKIQDRLVNLEDLDLSECEWVEPACMLPLSKMARLSRLVMRECGKLSEFVAYASLATRYGFKTLRILDLRGSPVGDSEVSALGWVPQLEQLYLSPAPMTPRHADHAHFSRDPWPAYQELEAWEEQEPEYYSSKYSAEKWITAELNTRPRRRNPNDSSAIGSCVVLQHSVPNPSLQPNCVRLETPRENAPTYCRINMTAPKNANPQNQDSANAQVSGARDKAAEGARSTAQNRSSGLFDEKAGACGDLEYCRRTINMYPDNDCDNAKRESGDGENYAPIKRFRSSNPPENDAAGTSKHEPCATKASKKFYDDRCQVSRALLQDSLEDFKKRTENPDKQDYKPSHDDGNLDYSGSDPSDNDDDAADSPQPKRARVAVNEGASTSKSVQQIDNVGDFKNDRSTSKKADVTKNLLIEMQSSHSLPETSVSESNRSANEMDQSTNESNRSNNEPTCSTIEPSVVIIGSIQRPNLKQNDKPKDDGNGTKHFPMNPSSEGSRAKGSSDSKNNKSSNETRQKYVRFRHNEPPVVIEGCNPDCGDNSNMYNNNDAQEPDWNDNDGIPVLEDQEIRSNPNRVGNIRQNPEAHLSRHRILYVNVGRRRHAMYQLTMPEPLDANTHRPLPSGYMNLIYSSNIAPRLEYTSLVTDAAIRRFGRADGENINYVQIGPNGPMPAPYDDPNARPNRSNLRVLSVTGFRHITNYSLTHLATAAPHLQSIDFTGTRVTEAGVQHFRNMRPDCRVRYGPVDTPKEDSGRPHSR